MTNRFAIIIESSNVRGQTDLPGARLDADNWITFLESDLGGAWGKEELCRLSKPTSGTLRTLVSRHFGDYVFLAFSGHGFEDYNSISGKYVTKICLNDNEQAVAIDMIAPSRLGTAVFDCCRGLEGGRRHISFANENLSNRSTVALNTKTALDEMLKKIQRRNVIRNIFLNDIEKRSVRDAIRMYSCSRNEGADEDPGAGGYYTSLLLQGAAEWSKAQNNNRYYNIYTTKQAHDYACIAMTQINPQQHPEYMPSWQIYPFAVG